MLLVLQDVSHRHTALDITAIHRLVKSILHFIAFKT